VAVDRSVIVHVVAIGVGRVRVCNRFDGDIVRCKSHDADIEVPNDLRILVLLHL
jgi:hypothetical protein